MIKMGDIKNDGFSDISEDSNSPETKISRSKYFDDFQKMFVTGRHSDFTIEAYTDPKNEGAKEEIQVHKSVLEARSKYFKIMIAKDCKEKNNNRVFIKDIVFAVLREVLRFIYTCKVDKLDDIAIDLMIAADKVSMIYDKRIGKIKNTDRF